MLHFAEIPLGSCGNRTCRRCHGADGQVLRAAAEVLADIERAVAAWSIGPGPNVAFTGIEPFDHPELTTLIRAAASKGARRIRIDSNAHAIATPATARAAVEAGVRHLQFGLLGSTAELHDSLAGDPGAFERTLAGVHAFAREAGAAGANIQVSARIDACRHNARDLPAMVAAAVRAGASYVRLSVAGGGLNVSAAPYIEAACDTGMVHATWVAVEGVPREAARGWELHLESVYPPADAEKPDASAQHAGGGASA